MCADNRLHTLGLEMLGLRGNHPIIFGDEKPHRLVLPKTVFGFFELAQKFQGFQDRPTRRCSAKTYRLQKTWQESANPTIAFLKFSVVRVFRWPDVPAPKFFLPRQNSSAPVPPAPRRPQPRSLLILLRLPRLSTWPPVIVRDPQARREHQSLPRSRY
jgi:hypothetical protein